MALKPTRPRLTPRTTEQRKQDEQDKQVLSVTPEDSDDSEDDEDDEGNEEEEEEELSDTYLASPKTSAGSLDHTNQTPRYDDEEFVTPEAARDRMLLDNHMQRMSFMQHLVDQTPENINKQLQQMMPEVVEQMDLLNTARVTRAWQQRNMKLATQTKLEALNETTTKQR